MDKICTRCARLSVQIRRPVYFRSLQPTLRKFSSSVRCDEEGQNKQSGSTSHSSQKSTVRSQDGRPLFRRQPTTASPGRDPRSQTTPTNQVLQRTRQPQGQLLSRTGGAPRQGQVLRRTGGPQTPGRPMRRTDGAKSQGASGKPGQGQQGQRRRRRPADRARGPVFDETAATDAEVDDYVAKFIDPPANPTEAIPYSPIAQSMEELQKDWPNTPLSAQGLTASVIQKMETLARRISHGYQTPEQIAEHFHKGNLTRFESEEEKQIVLKIAQQLAQKRADMLTERKGEQISPADMSISDMSMSKSNDDKKTLLDRVVKGDLQEVEKQRMPFLDSVVRNLRNNETYGNVEMGKFMARLESLMPAQNSRRAATQRKAN